MASARFDTLIVTQLRAQGFDLYPPDKTRAVWVQVRDSAGGFYDTYTGRVIETKRQAVVAQFRVTLRDAHQVEAILLPAVRPVTIPFGGGKVKWGGTEEESGGSGGVVGFLFGKSEGTIGALSLFVQVVDVDGKELYAREGGIQLTQRIQGDRMVPVYPTNLLTNMDRNIAAVHLALDSLARLTATAGP